MKIPELYYHIKNNEWNPIPSWANFMIILGMEFSGRRSDERRLNLVLTVPSRTFVAPFVAFGVMTHLFNKFNNNEFDESTIIEHFEKIAALETGTPLIYNKGDRVLKALYNGVEYVNGEKRIRVQTTSQKGGNLTYILDYKQSLMVRVTDKNDIKLPAKQIGRVSNIVSPFLKAGFQNINLERVLSQSCVEILFVGNKKNYERECRESLFAFKSGKRYYSGKLNDVLKIRTFTGDRDIYRSDLLLSQGNNSPKKKEELKESSIIIFDGASCFLAFREYFKEYPWIVVLDRTEVAYEQALNVLYNRYTEDRLPDYYHSFDSLSIPRGIEILSWEESL